MIKNPNIVAFDSEQKNIVKYYPNGTLQIVSNLKQIKKNDVRVSYLNSTKYISEVIEINRNIADEDLYDTIEVELYEELKLNYSENYKILYIEDKHAEPEQPGYKVYDTFVVNTLDLEETFKDTVSSIDFIDYILPAPLMFKSLYNKQIFSKNDKRVDCFIVFENDDAYLSIYRGGEFVYSKSFGYSLNRINEKISELIGQDLSSNNFYANLERYTSGNEINEVFGSYINQILEEVFINIGEILSFSQRVKKIEYFSNVYITMDQNINAIFLEYARRLLTSQENIEPLDIHYKNYDFTLDPMNSLLFLNARDFVSGNYDIYNISHAKRPIPFQERDSGRMASVILISLLVGSLYPLGELIYSYKLKLDKSSIDAKYKQLVIKKDTYKSQILFLNKEKDRLSSQIQEVNDNMSNKRNIINDIMKYRFNYKSKASTLSDLINYFSNSDVLVDTLDFNDSKIIMNVVSYKDKKITQLIKKINLDNKFNVYTSSLDDNNSIYKSTMEVNINE